MSRSVGPGRPPVESRFRKGQSGNPKGRPKKAKPQASAFIVIDRTLTVTQGGVPREVSAEEALQHRTYQDAIGGSRLAQRQVLKMIAKREQHLAAQLDKTRKQQFETLFEQDPGNAEAALLILGIIASDPRRDAPGCMNLQLLLEPWAVQAALSRRRGGPRLSREQVSEIERCTRDSALIRWPRGTRE